MAKLRFLLAMLVAFGIVSRSNIHAQISVDSLFAKMVARTGSISIKARLNALKDLSKK